jgi:hypothetical protein
LTTGVLISSSTPPDSLAIVAIFVLAFIVYIMHYKYKITVEQESIATAAVAVQDIPLNSQSSSINLTRMLLSINANTIDTPMNSSDSGTAGVYVKNIPWTTIGATSLTWAGYIFAFFVLTLIRKCSTAYIAITVIFYPLLFIVMFARMRYLMK